MSSGTVRRPPGASEALSRACSGCRRQPKTRAEVADLDVVWLVPGFDGGVAPARYCGDCAPRGQVRDHACTDCGDGPLLVDRFADPAADLFTSNALQEWLDATGWEGSLCPSCRPALPAGSAASAGSAGSAPGLRWAR